MFKQMVVLILVIFAAVSAFATDQEINSIENKAELGVWDGFRGIKWGEDIKAIPDMILKHDSGDGFTAYTRKNDDLTLGTVRLEQVWYGFYKGHFEWAAMVASAHKVRTYEIVLEENKQIEAMHNILSARFGAETGKTDPGRPQNIFARISKWKHSDVLVEFSPSGERVLNDKFPYHTYVELTYLPISEEMAKAKKAAQVASKASIEAEIEKAVFAIHTTKEGWDGFRGISWGAQFHSISGMVVDEDFGNGTICYTRDEDKDLVLAGVQVKKVLYCFYNGRFGWGTMMTKNGQNDNILKEILVRRYTRNSTKVYSRVPPYDWTKGDVSLKFFEEGTYGMSDNNGNKYLNKYLNKYPNNTNFELTYLPVARQKAKEDEANQKASDKIKNDKLKDATKRSF